MESLVFAPIPRKRTLNEIVEDFRRVLHTIDDVEGEVTPDLEEALTAAEDAFDDKVDRCLWVAQEALAQAGVYAERAKALDDRARVLKAQSKRLHDYVHGAMVALGVKRTETANFVATVADNPGSVVIDNEERFIESYKATSLVKTAYSPNKKAIAEALKGGQVVEGARIAKGTYLKVK